LILLYDMKTGEAKELRRDPAEPEFVSLHLLPHASPACIVASQTRKLCLFDISNARPITSWAMTENNAPFITHDPLQPNVFYARLAGTSRIGVFDKNVKNEVRSIIGMDRMYDIQVPVAPGNQLIANSATECRIWDVGTGRPVHTITGFHEGRASSMLGNAVAICEARNVRLYDLNQSVEEPAKNLGQGYQDMKEVHITSSKVIMLTHNYIWASTRFDS